MFHLPDCSCITFSSDPQQQHLLDTSATALYHSIGEEEDSSSSSDSSFHQFDETGFTPTPTPMPTSTILVEDKDSFMTEAANLPTVSYDSSVATFQRADSGKSDDTLGLLQDCVGKETGIPHDLEAPDGDTDHDTPGIPEVSSFPSSLIMTRLLRSSSLVSSEFHHCPICLDPMSPIDHQHPLQCPSRHCHFNFCMSCIQSLISSSKDDFEMASDGNAHVKIYLNCPNCRADLSTSIRDVLLLRKVDMVRWMLDRQKKDMSGSQKRTREAMEELHVQEAIQLAREKEVRFWQTHHRNSMTSLEAMGDDLSDGEHKGDIEDSIHRSQRQSLHRYESSRRLRDGSFVYEEWGVEADLDNGVHSSFRGSSTRFSDSSSAKKPDSGAGAGSKPSSFRKPMDETLLQGLEKCMTHSEQLQIIHWMTAGDPDQLAQAAQLLWRIEDDARQGVMPSDRQKIMNRRGSVFEIVEEARQIDCKTQQGPKGPNHNNSIGGVARYMTPRQRQQLQIQQQRAEQLKWEMALAARSSLLEKCPLPVRWPKAMVLELNQDPNARGFPLRFCNDNWDGTVLDAYTMLTINQVRRLPLPTSPRADRWTVAKKAQTSHPGVFHVLTQGLYKSHYGDVQLTRSGETPPRVLVASVQGSAGRQGVMKGDVVTHLDGVTLTPEEQSSEALVALLRAKKQAGQERVQLVLNAEASIAEALKRRAVVMDEHLSETTCS